MRLRNPFVMESGVFTTNYRDDMAFHYPMLAKLRVAAIMLLLFLLPVYAGTYLVSIANLVGIAIIGSLGLNILTGFTGQISIGHGAFLGVGAYAAGFITAKMGLPFWIALPAAGVITAAVGAIFGIPSLRLKGLYLAIATLAAQVIIEFVIAHWDGVTNGVHGMFLPAPQLFGFTLDNDVSYYYLVLVVCIIAAMFAFNLFRSRVGRAFVAVRDRDLAAEVMGINLFKYKIMAFALSSFYVGVAGALWGHYLRIISPEHFTIAVSIQYLAMVIIGGLGSVMGSIYGAVFITLLPIVLREIAGLFSTYFPNIETIILGLKEAVFGTTIVVFLIYEPEGLARIWQNIKDYFKLWPFSY
ncbi:branched-chain amino acid ABC transporter permease [Metallumcola ferriviriculae]|uniref:Branched-chain amino acid ABC transporter permease n=1 Tax=Metallumcola ferriviriculae TaxID=3039180 RepID=A0AAU0UNW2_9FIRM|nr:branched-chain amino acid ABC transporter permease [Desulfitibacteraceae bacterium MK1]